MSFSKPPMLGWTDQLTIDIEGAPTRHTVKDWYTSNPCAVVVRDRTNGQIIQNEVYLFFLKKAKGCQ